MAVLSFPRNLPRPDPFYDDSGYYAYVLLNGPQARKDDLLKLLRGNGLSVTLAGRSARPASNGAQYEWYVRVEDGSRPPSAERMAAVLARFRDVALPPSVTPRSDALLGVAPPARRDPQQVDIQRARAELAQGRHREASLRSQNESLRSSLAKTTAEAAQLREKNAALQDELLQSVPRADAEDIRQRYEARQMELLRQLRQNEEELRQKDEEYQSYVDNFEPEKQEQQARINELEAEKARLVDAYAAAQSASTSQTSGGGFKEFQSVVQLFLPHIAFLRGTFDALWQEMPDHLKVLQLLRDLSTLRGKRIQQAPGWMESPVGKDWRLYYRYCGGEKYDVLISHKNTQSADIAWLKRQ